MSRQNYYDLYGAYNLKYRNDLLNNQDLINNPNLQQGRNYIKSRQINNYILKKHELGICINNPKLPPTQEINKILNNQSYWTEISNIGLSNPEPDSTYQFLNNRITIPIKDDKGNVVGFCGRDFTNKSDTKYLYTKSIDDYEYGISKRHTLYNIENVKNLNTNEVFIVEGFFDVYALEKQGVENTLGLMGVSLNPQQIKLLKKHNIKNVNLALDNDNAGRDNTPLIAMDLLKNGINVNLYQIPSDEKDLDEYFINHPEGLEEFLNTKTTYAEYLFNKIGNDYSFYDFLNDIEENKLSRLLDNGNFMNDKWDYLKEINQDNKDFNLDFEKQYYLKFCHRNYLNPQGDWVNETLNQIKEEKQKSIKRQTAVDKLNKFINTIEVDNLRLYFSNQGVDDVDDAIVDLYFVENNDSANMKAHEDICEAIRNNVVDYKILNDDEVKMLGLDTPFDDVINNSNKKKLGHITISNKVENKLLDMNNWGIKQKVANVYDKFVENWCDDVAKDKIYNYNKGVNNSYWQELVDCKGSLDDIKKSLVDDIVYNRQWFENKPDNFMLGEKAERMLGFGKEEQKMFFNYHYQKSINKHFNDCINDIQLKEQKPKKKQKM